MNRKRLLDVGCGEAIEAIDFAKKGFIVFGVEKNKTIFEAARRNIKKAHQEKSITLINKNIRDVDLNIKFDLVIFSYVLMFMSKKEAYDLIEKYYEKLRLGGEIIVRMLMSDDKTVKNMREKRKTEVFFPTKEELKLLAEKFHANPDFKVIRDKPHGKMKYKHTHSTGHFRIKGSC